MNPYQTYASRSPDLSGIALRNAVLTPESPVEVMMRALDSALSVAHLDLLLDRIEAQQ